MAFGLIIIGDEILSGKREDKHFPKVLAILKERGLSLAWAEYLGDDPVRITDALRRALAGDDIVFSCGGIGATPDDHTRQCAAAALGVPLALHPDARQRIRDRMVEMAREAGKPIDLETPDNLQRLKMGEFPQGARLIENPYNKIPGFSIAGLAGAVVHFVPGFPVMAWPMIAAVLDAHHAELFHRTAWFEQSVLVYEMAESTLTPLMEEVEAAYPQTKVFSLPSVGDAVTRRHIELGVKGEPAQAQAGLAHMLAALDAMGAEHAPTPVPEASS